MEEIGSKAGSSEPNGHHPSPSHLALHISLSVILNLFQDLAFLFFVIPNDFERARNRTYSLSFPTIPSKRGIGRRRPEAVAFIQYCSGPAFFSIKACIGNPFPPAPHQEFFSHCVRAPRAAGQSRLSILTAPVSSSRHGPPPQKLVVSDRLCVITLSRGHVMKSLMHPAKRILISLLAVLILSPVTVTLADDDRDEYWEDYYDDRHEDYEDYYEDYEDYYEDVPRGAPYGYGEMPPYGYGGIPPGHLPPPGECRVWYPGVPPGQQPPPFECY